MIHGTPSRAGCRQTVRPHAYARKHEPGSDGDKPAAGPGHVPARGIAAPRHGAMMLLGTVRVHGRDLDVLVCWRHRGAVPG